MITINVHNVKSQITGQLEPKVIAALRTKLSAELPGAFFAKRYSNFYGAGVKYFFTPKTQVFPTGMIHYVRDILDQFGIEWEIVDHRPQVQRGQELPLHGITLRDYQQEAINLAVEKQRGIARMGTGAGKSSVISGIIGKLNVKTLILIHKQDIFYQLINTFERILKVPIGKIGDGECDFQNVTVAMIQTVAHVFDPKVKVLAKDDAIIKEKSDAIKQFLSEIECVLIDEAHHIAADTFWDVMQNIP